MSTATAMRSVDSAYVHYDKFVEPGDSVTLASSTLKWYDIAVKDAPVPIEIRDTAVNFLMAESAAGKLDPLGDLGFVILHRCGREFYFLLVSSWRNENELWETVYAKKSDAETGFSLFPLPGPHRGTFCVWELAAVWHEQQAWRRFLMSERDEKAMRDYIADSYRGIV